MDKEERKRALEKAEIRVMEATMRWHKVWDCGETVSNEVLQEMADACVDLNVLRNPDILADARDELAELVSPAAETLGNDVDAKLEAILSKLNQVIAIRDAFEQRH